MAGHAQDVARYAERLQLVDGYLTHLMSLLDKDDVLVVMADHGNDPTIGHSQHTRECVPLLVWRPGVTGIRLVIAPPCPTWALPFAKPSALPHRRTAPLFLITAGELT